MPDLLVRGAFQTAILLGLAGFAVNVAEIRFFFFEPWFHNVRVFFSSHKFIMVKSPLHCLTINCHFALGRISLCTRKMAFPVDCHLNHRCLKEID
jgi:hypothetical protein